MGLVGLLPAAGKATRFDGIPKFALPTRTGTLLGDMATFMLDSGVEHVFIGTSESNYELVRSIAPDNTTIYTVQSTTMSETVLCAWPMILGNDVVFAMPDTCFDDSEAFVKLKRQLDNGADVAVGLWEAEPEQRRALGMVDLDASNRVLEIVDKPIVTNLTHAWGALAWKSQYLSLWHMIDPEHPHIGYAVQDAIRAGMNVRATEMYGEYVDCGNRHSYFDMIRRTTQ